jgi:hypothetical protein
MGGRRCGDLLGTGAGGAGLTGDFAGEGVPFTAYGFGERERERGTGDEGGVTNCEDMSLTGDLIVFGGSGFQSSSPGRAAGESLEYLLWSEAESVPIESRGTWPSILSATWPGERGG